MARLICSSSTTVCTGNVAGLAIGFSVAAGTAVRAGVAEVARVRDNEPILSIRSFGACKPSSPPKPSVPVLSDFKDAFPKLLVGNSPALTEACTLRCKQVAVTSFRHHGQSSTELAHNGLPPRGGRGRVSEWFSAALRGLCASMEVN